MIGKLLVGWFSVSRNAALIGGSNESSYAFQGQPEDSMALEWASSPTWIGQLVRGEESATPFLMAPPSFPARTNAKPTKPPITPPNHIQKPACTRSQGGIDGVDCDDWKKVGSRPDAPNQFREGLSYGILDVQQRGPIRKLEA